MVVIRGPHTLVRVNDLCAVIPTAQWQKHIDECFKSGSNPKTAALAYAMRQVQWPIGGFQS